MSRSATRHLSYRERNRMLRERRQRMREMTYKWTLLTAMAAGSWVIVWLLAYGLSVVVGWTLGLL